MSYADNVFIKNISDILNHGISDEKLIVRPHWEDGTPAHTTSLFGVVNRYDLSKEFPILTLRRTFWKSALDEILWIYQKKSNSIHELGSHVWDQWADENGTIGKAYGYQLSVKHRVNGIDLNKAQDLFGTDAVVKVELPDHLFHLSKDSSEIESYVNQQAKPAHVAVSSNGNVWMDQVDHMLYDLKFNRASRRIMTTTWNPTDAVDMGLEPCAYSMTFNVKGNKLNAILNQRSQDMIAASAWNTCQYAFLVLILCHIFSYEPGEFVHVIGDCHIYDRHIELAKEIIANRSFDAPKVTFDPDVHNFYQVTKNSFTLENYLYSDFSKVIPIAI